MSKDEQRAKKIAAWAKEDLVEAREWAKNSATPEEQRQARRMAKLAKRRHAKANRRAGRAQCRDWDDAA
jgi:hypothetical protein